MASAGDKGFASLRHRAGEDFRALPTDLRGDALEIRVQGFGQLRPGRLGPRGTEVSERLDPTTAPFLVMPEIQVWPPSDRLRRHATTDLHGSRMLFSWPRRRGYFPRTASTSCSTVVPSRNVQASCPSPTISRYVAKSRT